MGLNRLLNRFLKKFYEALKGRPNNPDLQNLSRFIFSRNDYSKGTPKPSAFLPPKGKTAISMFFIDELPEEEIWPLGDEVGKNRGRPVIARADTQRNFISALKIGFESTPHEHPRHVNVVGWPKEKDKQKALALEFCIRSTLKVRL